MRSILSILVLTFIGCAPANPEPVAVSVPTGSAPDAIPEPAPTTPDLFPTASPVVSASADLTPIQPVVACTKMGCSDQLGIQFSPTAPKPGTYSVTVTVDRKSTTCEITFPHPVGAETASKCKGALELSTVEDKATMPVLRLAGTPEAVQVAVKLGRTKLVDETFTPAVTDFRPNGEQCEPVCKNGSVRVDLGDAAKP